ncbi:hypothetical protein RclHR1_02800007 [Rhizophagus clarus]|uniref:Uncharacterized protein n=1 Tax=Rhizophagus clarus TaxID=94130 RepID=A0A2Z6R2N8_9GLOM|nr:hypothetical protein RclHR1_02800007 [Rhizophagus clarus]
MLRRYPGYGKIVSIQGTPNRSNGCSNEAIGLIGCSETYRFILGYEFSLCEPPGTKTEDKSKIRNMHQTLIRGKNFISLSRFKCIKQGAERKLTPGRSDRPKEYRSRIRRLITTKREKSSIIVSPLTENISGKAFDTSKKKKRSQEEMEPQLSDSHTSDEALWNC